MAGRSLVKKLKGALGIESVLAAAEVQAVRTLAAGGNLTATLDGSNRLASLANVSTGRTLTLTYTDPTHLTIRDNGVPQAEVMLVLDASQRLVSATGNF